MKAEDDVPAARREDGLVEIDLIIVEAALAAAQLDDHTTATVGFVGGLEDPDRGVPLLAALALACGRLGLTYAEYRALASGDPELVELERQVIADAQLPVLIIPT